MFYCNGESNRTLLKLYDPFFGWGSTASKLEPLQGGSLLFTTKFLEISGTHFIDLGRMKGWVELGTTQLFWTRDLWIGNPAPYSSTTNTVWRVPNTAWSCVRITLKYICIMSTEQFNISTNTSWNTSFTFTFKDSFFSIHTYDLSVC